jgi:hypothetical protein
MREPDGASATGLVDDNTGDMVGTRGSTDSSTGDMVGANAATAVWVRRDHGLLLGSDIESVYRCATLMICDCCESEVRRM